MKLHKQIRKYRKQVGLSQEKLANEIFVTRQTISNWENDRSYPDVESLLLLSTCFGISLDTLIKGDIDVMKHELENRNMSFWTMIMLIFLVSGIVIGIPLTYFYSYGGMAIAIILLGIGLFGSCRIEVIKKNNNLKTYQDIVNFMEGKELNTESKRKTRQGLLKQQILMIAGSMMITLIISGVVLMILHWVTGFVI